MANTKRRGIQSIEIGYRILACIEKSSRPQSLTEISKAVGMSHSKLQFYLISLTKTGLLSQDLETGRYMLGPSALRLGLSALMHVDALEITRKAMAGLLTRSGNHNIFLSVWGNHGPVIILRNDGREAYPFAVQVGTVLPVLGSATGNIYLTYLPPAVTQKSVEREIENSRRNSGPNRKFPWGIVNQIITEV